MRTTILNTQRVMAGDVGTLTFQLQNQAGQNLTLGQIDSLQLTLYAEDFGQAGICNSRDAQNVLNLNQVTVSAGALVTWNWIAADMPFLHPERPAEFEIHIAKFVAKWGSGTGQHTFFCRFEIERTGI